MTIELSAAVQRFDLDTQPRIERMPNGAYRISARATRVGVLEYVLPDGSIRRELRLPEDVFSEDSMRSLRGVALTDLHPAQPVTPDNWAQLARGHIGDDVRPDGIYLACTAVVSHADMIGLIDRQLRHDLSCGYTTQLELKGGVWEGQPYDAIQRNIVYNHVAAGPREWGRAGTDVSLRVDGGYSTLPEMALHKIDGIDYEIGSKAHTDAVDRFIANQAAVIKTATDRADASDKVAKDATDKVASTLANVPKMVEERSWLISLGRRKDAKFCTDKKDAGMSTEELLVKVLKMVLPDFNAAGKSPEAIMAVLEAYGPKEAAEPEAPKDPPAPSADVLAGGAAPALDSLAAVRSAPAPATVNADAAEMTIDQIIAADRARRADQAAVRVTK